MATALVAVANLVALADADVDVLPFCINFFLVISLRTLVCTANFLETDFESLETEGLETEGLETEGLETTLAACATIFLTSIIFLVGDVAITLAIIFLATSFTTTAFCVALADAEADVLPFCINFFLVTSLRTLVCTANFLETDLDLSLVISLATTAATFLVVAGDVTFAKDALTICLTFSTFFELDDCVFLPRSFLNLFFNTFLMELAFLLASKEAVLEETPCFINVFFSFFLRLATFLSTILLTDFEVFDDLPALTLLSRLTAFLTSDAFLSAALDANLEETP